MTSSGIEAATFRFVAQHLNHCATAVPNKSFYITQLCVKLVIYPEYKPGFPESAHVIGSATSSQGIRGYVSVTAASKFTYLLK